MRMRCWTIPGILPILPILVATGALAAAVSEPVAVLTEIRAGQGEVRVKLTPEADWTTPLPLLSLRSGDQIRATQNAVAVLMFTGGQGTTTVSAANSPYTVQPPSVTSSSPTRELVKSLGRLLMRQKKELVHVPLATRKVEQRPLLVAPRDGTLLGTPKFEWAGSNLLRYTVRIAGPEGVVWEQSNLPRAPLTYPTTAPRLQPGVAYRWELEVKGFPTRQGRFTILPEAEAAAVRNALASLVSWRCRDTRPTRLSSCGRRTSLSGGSSPRRGPSSSRRWPRTPTSQACT
jgi:hypothetical protein